MESLENVKVLIEEEIVKLGFNLYSLKFNNSKDKVLEIIIDRDTPINLDDITEVSHRVSDLLDRHDFIDEAYVLDVSSLGIEKPIDINYLDKYIGQYVNIHTTHPYKGESYLEGTIEKVEDGNVELVYFVKGKKTKANLEIKYLDKARLAVKF